MTRPVRLELAAHAHATEDEGRVRRALLNLVPPELRGRAELERVVVEGHYSNPIVRLTLRLEGEDAVAALRHLASALDEYEKRLLDATLESRYDGREGRLYVRLSKQEAYLGRVRIFEGDDVVRMVVVFQGAPGVDEVRRALREVGLLP